MSIKYRLIVMNFLEFFVWGAWLISLGAYAANTLHFHRDKLPIVRSLKSHLREGGRMLLVEYNIDAGNYAVPHPLPFSAWQTLAAQAGFSHTELMMTRPSRFLKEIYSAGSW